MGLRRTGTVSRMPIATLGAVPITTHLQGGLVL